MCALYRHVRRENQLQNRSIAVEDLVLDPADSQDLPIKQKIHGISSIFYDIMQNIELKYCQLVVDSVGKKE